MKLEAERRGRSSRLRGTSRICERDLPESLGQDPPSVAPEGTSPAATLLWDSSPQAWEGMNSGLWGSVPAAPGDSRVPPATLGCDDCLVRLRAHSELPEARSWFPGMNGTD